MYGYVDNSVNPSDYDYYVNYNPYDDYYVLTLDIMIFTQKEEIINNFIKNIDVSKSFDTYEYYNDNYYVNELTKNETETEDGYTHIKRVYIMNENPDKLYLSCRDLGNNVMVKLYWENRKEAANENKNMWLQQEIKRLYDSFKY